MLDKNPIFGFIVIEARSARCMLAARLSANGCDKILLVEAGGKERSSPAHLEIIGPVVRLGMARRIGMPSARDCSSGLLEEAADIRPPGGVRDW